MAPTVAALYVDASGPYAGRADVDAWPLERDARRYAGPLPVIAHPPCGPWGAYFYKATESRVLALTALEQVRTYGGVLEHPANSRLWSHAALPQPGATNENETTLAVRQVDWGHRAEKPTWLLIVGADKIPQLPPKRPTPPRPRPYKSGRQPRGVLETMSHRQRRLTPPAFADWLIELARTCRP